MESAPSQWKKYFDAPSILILFGNEAELMHFKFTHLSPRKKKNIYTPKLSKSDGCIASAMFFRPLQD